MIPEIRDIPQSNDQDFTPPVRLATGTALTPAANHNFCVLVFLLEKEGRNIEALVLDTTINQRSE